MRVRLAVMLAALWWGSLAATGFLAVPILFAHLPAPAMAGGVAARLFAAQAWLSMACGVLLLMASRQREGAASRGWAGGAVGFVVAGLLLAVLGEFAVAPRIVARENLALWHGLGSGMYLFQWIAAGVVLWKLSRAAGLSPGAPS